MGAAVASSLPRIFLVRHGETEWTITGRHTGRTDIPLTDSGESDARALQARLQALRVSLVLTSPLQRARRTAELAGFGDLAQIDPDLTEWNYGAYEGRRTADIRAERPDWNLFEHGCPGGESADDVGVRADRVIARLRSNAADGLLFGHRDFLRVLAVRWVGLLPSDGRRLTLATTSLSTLGYDHSLAEPVIHEWNDR